MSSETVAARTHYEVPSANLPVPQSHPDRLAAVATLFGMQPQPVDRCRVLELGCVSGGNLIPMAERHPQSTFVGVDSSERRIAIARRAAEVLELTNVDFRHLNIADANEQFGTFDYVICHDLFSSVEPEEQEAILAVCKSRLKPAGVAYVSYDTYPGCFLPQLALQLAREATTSASPPASRVAQARNVLLFLSESAASEDAPHARLLKQSVDRALARPDDELAAVLLREVSYPLYFHQFVERAAARGLRYLGDADISPMFTATFPAATEHNLLQVSTDAVSLEQHIDWLRNRAVHHTLLVHRDVELENRILSDRLRGLFFAAKIRPESVAPDVRSATPERFTSAAGGVIGSAVPIVKAALAELSAAWPRAKSFAELANAAAAAVAPDPTKGDSPTPEQQAVLEQNLSHCVASGFVEVHSAADSFTTTISPRPHAGRLARLQAESSSRVTNRRHEPIILDNTSLYLLPYLDGNHDRTALLGILEAAIGRGDLSLLMDKMPASGGQAASEILQRTLDESLVGLAAYALMVG